MRLSRNITPRNHGEIIRDVERAPLGWRVTIEEPRRTSQQNALMWALLQAFADQVEHCGQKYPAATWKCILMKALGKELEFAPSLDGEEIVALGYRSSDLSKQEISDLIEFIYAEGAKRGLTFREERAA